MASTRYREEFNEVVYRAIAIAGIDQAGWEAIGISKRTFYEWMGRYPDFESSVIEARAFHAKSSPEALKLRLLAYVINILENGCVVETKTTTRIIFRDRNNQPISFQDVEVVEQKQLPLPKWIADKILPNAATLESAIKTVLQAGFDVSDPSNLLPSSTR